MYAGVTRDFTVCVGGRVASTRLARAVDLHRSVLRCVLVQRVGGMGGQRSSLIVTFLDLELE